MKHAVSMQVQDTEFAVGVENVSMRKPLQEMAFIF